MRPRIALGLGVLLLFAACGDDDVAETTTTAATETTATTTMPTTTMAETTTSAAADASTTAPAAGDLPDTLPSGTYIVGLEIKPGSWEPDECGCVWSLVDEEGTETAGTSEDARIGAMDYSVKLGPCTWTFSG